VKIQHLLITLALPAILALTGCEATAPTVETKAEPVAAPAAKNEAPAPVAEANTEHCDKHVSESGHDCIAHCAKHKGKKAKQCLKHCAAHHSAMEKQCNAHHCSHHKGGSAHQCSAEHCQKHGGDMSKCCGSEQKCAK
jgi:hypothetical protein